MKTIQSEHGEVRVYDRMGNHTTVRQDKDVICLTPSESLDLARALMGEWKPIETMPDGETIWVKWVDGNISMRTHYFTYPKDNNITGWMPILKPQI